MNRKGTYSGIIASIVIVAIIAVAFSSSATVSAQAQADYAKAIIDLKKEWQQARYLLDKSASDAIADTIVNNSCNYDIDLIRPALEGDAGYFRLTLNEASLQDCSVQIVDVKGPENNIQIEVNIYCNKTNANFNTAYGKNRVKFVKSASHDSTSGCDVDVKDSDSGICEVDPDADDCA